MFGIVLFSVFGQNEAENPYYTRISTGYNVATSIDNGTAYLNKHFIGLGNLTPIIMTFANSDGSVSVCANDSWGVYIYEYSRNLSFIKTIRLNNEFNKLGAFTKDEDGNYYLFSAKDVQEGAFDEKNMALVKYKSDGEKTAVFYLSAQISDRFSGVKIPFSTGSCRMEISGDQIAVYFARQMFMAPDGLNHQASYGFILDKNNLEMITVKMPYVSHSFNQYILPIENGFAFADQGDVFPRGFNFAKIQNSQRKKDLTAFKFKQNSLYQNTFAQLGGLAKTSNGYIFAGTYEKNTVVSGSHNDSRNMFILTFDDNLTACSEPVWITNYNDKEKLNAASPKITALDSGRYLLMWECMAQNAYGATYMTIINENGKLLKPIIRLGYVRLNINDPLRYNKKTGNVYWAVDAGNTGIDIYAFNPDKPINTKSY